MSNDDSAMGDFTILLGKLAEKSRQSDEANATWVERLQMMKRKLDGYIEMCTETGTPGVRILKLGSKS